MTVKGYKSETQLTLDLLNTIIGLKERIELKGIEDMLHRAFSSIWEKPPDYYLVGEGGQVLDGFVTTLKGVNAELEALVSASRIGPQIGEKVFSGSNYSATGVFADKTTPVSEDVDVSFIDQTGTLNLIEVGASLSVLMNKFTGPKIKPGIAPETQKQRYEYLSKQAETLIHKPKDEA